MTVPRSEQVELKNRDHLNICHGNSNKIVTGFQEVAKCKGFLHKTEKCNIWKVSIFRDERDILYHFKSSQDKINSYCDYNH